jgi:hypothetical protein
MLPTSKYLLVQDKIMVDHTRRSLQRAIMWWTPMSSLECSLHCGVVGVVRHRSLMHRTIFTRLSEAEHFICRASLWILIYEALNGA